MKRNKNLYVMSDIHNDYHNFKKMIRKINFGKDDKLYILGDIFDRSQNPQPVELYFEILKYDNMVCLKGNHDNWLAEHIYDDIQSKSKTKYYYNTYDILRKRLPEYDCLELTKWIIRQPLQEEIECNGTHFLLAHAATSFEEKLSNYFLMGDDAFFESHGVYGYISIVGHTPTETLRFRFNQLDSWNHKKNFSIWYSPDNQIIDIDCGNGYRNEGGRLGCLRLNDFKEFYV